MESVNIQTDHPKFHHPSSRKQNLPPSHSKANSNFEANNSKVNDLSKYNINLHKLLDLAQKMDIVYEEHYRKISDKKNIDNDPRIIKITQEIHEQQMYKQKLKNKSKKQQLKINATYDQDKYVADCNQLRYYQKELAQLHKEKLYLQKIWRQQRKAVNQAIDKGALKKKGKLEQQVKEQSQNNKQKIQSINKLQRKILQLHTKLSEKITYHSQLTNLLQKHRKSESPSITPEILDQLTEQYSKLELQRQNYANECQRQIDRLNRQRRELEKEVECQTYMLQNLKKSNRFIMSKSKYLMRMALSLNNRNYTSKSEHSRVENIGQPMKNVKTQTHQILEESSEHYQTSSFVKDESSTPADNEQLMSVKDEKDDNTKEPIFLTKQNDHQEYEDDDQMIDD